MNRASRTNACRLAVAIVAAALGPLFTGPSVARADELMPAECTCYVLEDPSSVWTIEDNVGTGDEGRIAVVVQADLYCDISASIDQYAADLAAEGHQVVVALFNGRAEALRAHLANLWAEPPTLTGAVLVGKLPWAVMGTESDCYPVEAFLMDMDFDGNWILQSLPHSRYTGSGDGDPEIWVSRIKTDLLADSEIPLQARRQEVALIRGYFARNNALRGNLFQPSHWALAYVGDDPAHHVGPHSAALTRAFGNHVTAVDGDPYDVSRLDYLGRLSGFDPDEYHYVIEKGHGGFASHTFSSGPGGAVTWEDYFDPPLGYGPYTPIGLTLNSCYCGRFTYRPSMSERNIATCAAFGPDTNCLIVHAYAEQSSSYAYDTLWREVGSGLCYGDAYRYWFQAHSMPYSVLLGDGTLKGPAYWWVGEGATPAWSIADNWADQTPPAETSQVRIRGDAVQFDLGTPEEVAPVRSVLLWDAASLTIQADRGLGIANTLAAEPGTPSDVTLEPYSTLQASCIRNLNVTLQAGTAAHPTTLSVVDGDIVACDLTLHDYCAVSSVRIEDADISVESTTVPVPISGTLSRSTVTVQPGAMATLGTVGDDSHLELGAGALAVVASVDRSSGALAAQADLNVTGTFNSAHDWTLTDASLDAGVSTLSGEWSLDGSTACFEELGVVASRTLRIDLDNGSSVNIGRLPVEVEGATVHYPFDGEEENELRYGTPRATAGNVFGGGSETSENLRVLYFGTNTRICPTAPAPGLNLTLDLDCSLAIASEFSSEFVRAAWNTRSVDVIAQPIERALASPYDTQRVELISPATAIWYHGSPLAFMDVPCHGGFRDLVLPGSYGDDPDNILPTVMADDYVNAALGWGTEESSGFFRNISLGQYRVLKLYSSYGKIHYTGTLTYNQSSRVYLDDVELAHPFTAAIQPVVGTIYGDWNGDCIISNVELADLQNAMAALPGTYDPLMDYNCDGTLTNVETAAFLDNMAAQPPCGGRGDKSGGEKDGEKSQREGEDDGVKSREFDEPFVDVPALAEWLAKELPPDDLAKKIDELAAAAEEFAGTPVGEDLADLVYYLKLQ